MIIKLYIQNILQFLFTVHHCQPTLIPLNIVICLFTVYTIYELQWSASYFSSHLHWIVPAYTNLTTHIHFCATGKNNCLPVAWRCGSKQQARQQRKPLQVENFQPASAQVYAWQWLPVPSCKWSESKGGYRAHGVLYRMATVTPGGTWDQRHGAKLVSTASVGWFGLFFFGGWFFWKCSSWSWKQ